MAGRLAILGSFGELFASISLPSIISVSSIHASAVTGLPVEDVAQIPNFGHYPSGEIDFCNVTIVYRHPGEDGHPITFEAWLPGHASWNERLVASGGSGFAAGRSPDTYRFMSGLVADGYASFTTDGGAPNVANMEFALERPGVLDETALRNWGSVAIGDMAIIGKQVVAEYYGQPATYSYFAGCSQGGRHGYDLAQKHPELFDGIAAAAPAISMLDAMHSIFWPQFLMNQAGSWPRGCELDSLTAYAVRECDAADGVEDGVISGPASACIESFDPFLHVGEPAAACDDRTSRITEAAARIANATWSGLPSQDGREILYPGLLPGSDLTGRATGIGVATTTCLDTGTGDQSCRGAPIELGYAPARIFGMRDADFNYTELSPERFHCGLKEAKQVFGRELQSSDPDLSEFKKKGGKLITYHGLADQLLSPGIVRRYYDRATEKVQDIHDFYRYFEIPGLPHCVGPQHPDSAFDALRRWVEEGVAPDTLPYRQPDAEGNQGERVACAYPKVATYRSYCGDPNLARCYECK